MRGVELREKSIRIVFRYNGKQCKETLKLGGAPLAPTPANAKYAARLASEIIKQINAGVFDYAATFPGSTNAPKAAGLTGDELFFDLIERWFDLLELKTSTKSQYRRQKDRFWKVHLPNKPIKSFVHSDIKKALQQGTWKSNKSRNNQLSIIRGVFELAVLDKQIPQNPCDGLDYVSVQKKKPDPFSQAEVRMILIELAKKYQPPIVNFVQFQFSVTLTMTNLGSTSVLPIQFFGHQLLSTWASGTAGHTTRATHMPRWV